MTIENEAKAQTAQAVVRHALNERLRVALGEKELDREELASKLEMLPSGVDLLLSETEWSLEEALWLVDALGLEVRVEVNEGPTNGAG